jgi:hypothetical protein
MSVAERSEARAASLARMEDVGAAQSLSSGRTSRGPVGAFAPGTLAARALGRFGLTLGQHEIDRAPHQRVDGGVRRGG